MGNPAPWFEVDKKGLAKLLEKRGKEFVVFELIQNAWDQRVAEVRVSVVPVEGSVGYAHLVVEDDDPDEFRDLSHAFTLFAESDKKSDAGKRGRFNLGEKLVLALCRKATIKSTKGAVMFDDEGRHILRTKRDVGSEFSGEIRMNKEEREEVAKAVRRLIPPVETYFNGERLPDRDPVKTIHTSLLTEMADDEGTLRKVVRQTAVTIHEVLPGETAYLYELGIPIVETGDKWHVNVRQKVPLNMDRDNVPPSYLRELRGLILNNTHELLEEDDAQAGWLREAASAKNVSDDAVEAVMDLRFGPKRVAFDPHDPEANKLAVSQGYTVVHGGSLSADEWSNVKRAEVIKPAGQVTPSPKPFSPDGEPLTTIPFEDLTTPMRAFVSYALELGEALLSKELVVIMTKDPGFRFRGAFGSGQLYVNVGGRFGAKWIENQEEVNGFLLHEFAHHYSSDHLASEYHGAICKLGAKMTQLALTKPELFRR